MLAMTLAISASIVSVDLFLAIVRHLLVHERLAGSQEFADLICTVADAVCIQPKRTQDDLLSPGDCMIQLVYSAVSADHLDLFQFADRSRDSHILLSGFHPQHLLFQKIGDPVEDDQCHELDKDLCRHTL